MNISKDIQNSLASLSAVNLEFLDFVDKNPEYLSRANFIDLDEVRTRLFYLQSWPTFLSKNTKTEFENASINVFQLLKSIPERIFKNNIRKMSEYYEKPVSFIEFQMDGVTPTHLNNLMSRGDFLYTNNGLKCMEYNVTSNIGGLQVSMWESLYLKNPLIRRFLEENNITVYNQNILELFLHYLMKLAAPLVSPANGAMNIAFIVPQPLPANDEMSVIIPNLEKIFPQVLKRNYPSLGGQIVQCDFQSLEVIGDRVYHKGKEIQVAVQWVVDVPPPRVMKAFKTGHFILINGPISSLIAAKANLALLSEHAELNPDLFSAEEHETIRQNIPWTRRIVPGETRYQGQSVRLEEFIISHKDQLVIKASLGYGGQQVIIGKSTPLAAWTEKIVAAAKSKAWVVQEAITSVSVLSQHEEYGTAPYDLALGMIVLGTQYVGTLLRIILKKDAPRIVNLHQGAQVCIFLEVDH